MERSDKHSPRVDDDLAHSQRSILQGSPVDARLQEHRREEGPGPRPGQPSASSTTADRAPGTSEGLNALEIDLRSELATYVDGAIFPADRDQILLDAQSNHAPEPVIDLIERLPEDTTFDRVQAVWDAAHSS